MLSRRIGVRQGRKVLPTPIARTWVRRLTQQPPSPTGAAQPRTGSSQPTTEQALQDEDLRRNMPSQSTSHKCPKGSEEARQHLMARFEARNLKRDVSRATGSVVEQKYDPKSFLREPPSAKDVTLEALMAAQTHMGHHKSLWNPDNSRYIYGVRNGIHIISLETTAAHLRRAATVVEEVAYRAGIIMFVGTRKGHRRIVTNAASLSGACHLFEKWTPGAITNRDIILRNKEMKIVDEHDKELAGFERHLLNARPLTPDLVVCFNPIENYTMLYECGLGGIPTIGVVDTDADPSWVTYTIPANDDSLRSITFIAGVLGQAAKQGRDRRLRAAEQSKVTWQTPIDVQKFMRGMKRRRPELLESLLEKNAGATQAKPKAQGEDEETDDMKRWETESDEQLEELAREMGWDKLTGDQGLDEGVEVRTLDAAKAAEAIEDMGTDEVMKTLEELELADETDAALTSKEEDEEIIMAETKALGELGSAPDGESESELNERIMKGVDVDKGISEETTLEVKKPETETMPEAKTAPETKAVPETKTMLAAQAPEPIMPEPKKPEVETVPEAKVVPETKTTPAAQTSEPTTAEPITPEPKKPEVETVPEAKTVPETKTTPAAQAPEPTTQEPIMAEPKEPDVKMTPEVKVMPEPKAPEKKLEAKKPEAKLTPEVKSTPEPTAPGAKTLEEKKPEEMPEEKKKLAEERPADKKPEDTSEESKVQDTPKNETSGKK